MPGKGPEMQTPELGTAAWRKSSRSSATGQCTEVAYLGAGVAGRDSKDPDGPVLLFTPTAGRAFTAGLPGGNR